MKRVAMLFLTCLLVGTSAFATAQTEAAQKQTFTAMKVKNVNMGDINTNDFTLYLEERTGIHINWEIVPDQSTVTLAFSSGDLPDFTLGYVGFDKIAEMRYAASKIIIPLDEYVDTVMPAYSKLLAKFPEVRKAISHPDGNMYHFPNMAQDNHGFVSATGLPGRSYR